MSGPRAARLLDLVEILRRHRRPVAGEALANELGVSLRTFYRDIVALQDQGVRGLRVFHPNDMPA